jgi:hypothetical protein
MSQQVSTNTFGCAKWIVSSDATQGTHTTIAAALTSASSGDTIFIRPGTYTENLTLKAGVDLAAYDCNASNGSVLIVGKCTLTTGSVSCSGIRFKTNGDNFLTMSSTGFIIFTDCYLAVLGNATGISYTSASSNSRIVFKRCSGDISDANSKFLNSSSTGIILFDYCFITNGDATGVNSTTASTISAGSIRTFACALGFQITSSGTAAVNCKDTDFSYEESGTSSNSTWLTLGGSGTNRIDRCYISGGTATAISAGTATAIYESTISSSNAAAISGAGTLSLSEVSFIDSSSAISNTISSLVCRIGSLTLNTALTVPNGGTGVTSNTAYAVLCGGTTSTAAVQSIASVGTANQALTSNGAGALPSFQTPDVSWLTGTVGTWSPVIEGAAVAGTINYTVRLGRYQKVANFVSYQLEITWTTIGTASGGILIKSFPFTFKNVTSYNVSSPWVGINFGLAPGAGNFPVVYASPNTTQMAVNGVSETTGLFTATAIGANQAINFNFTAEV